MQLLHENCKTLSDHAVPQVRAGVRLDCFKPPVLLCGARPGWKAARTVRHQGSGADLGAHRRHRVPWVQAEAAPGLQERGRSRGFPLGAGVGDGDIAGA